jgi:hypothetical protein
LLVRQFRETPKQISADKRPFLAAADAREITLKECCRGVVRGMTPLATLVIEEMVVEDRIDPFAQLTVAVAMTPARKRSLEGVLHKIVGTVPIAAKQRTSEAAQPRNMRFNKSG